MTHSWVSRVWRGPRWDERLIRLFFTAGTTSIFRVFCTAWDHIWSTDLKMKNFQYELLNHVIPSLSSLHLFYWWRIRPHLKYLWYFYFHFMEIRLFFSLAWVSLRLRWPSLFFEYELIKLTDFRSIITVDTRDELVQVSLFLQGVITRVSAFLKMWTQVIKRHVLTFQHSTVIFNTECTINLMLSEVAI